MKFLCWLLGHKTEERTLFDALGGKAPPMPLRKLQYYVAVYRRHSETREQAQVRHLTEWEDISKEMVVHACVRCPHIEYKEHDEDIQV